MLTITHQYGNYKILTSLLAVLAVSVFMAPQSARAVTDGTVGISTTAMEEVERSRDRQVQSSRADSQEGGLSTRWSRTQAAAENNNGGTGSAVRTQSVNAEALRQMNREEIIQLIRNLLEQLTTQQQTQQRNWSTAPRSETAPTPGTRGVGLAIGGEVQVLERLRVREEAGLRAEAVGTVGAGVRGRVQEGPLEQDGYQWWYVTYNDGTAGWSVGQWLQAMRTTQGIGRDEQFPEVVITPPTGVAPLQVRVLSRHSANTYPELEINFGDGEWKALAGCERQGDTACIQAGETTHTLTEAGDYTVALRNGVIEREVKQLRVLGTREGTRFMTY